jgi:hypothetical protein
MGLDVKIKKILSGLPKIRPTNRGGLFIQVVDFTGFTVHSCVFRTMEDTSGLS